MESHVYSGDNLLEVFKKVNIQIGDLHPNVIRGWFDTDCKETKDFLEWMCSSLTEDNYVSPLESLEYEKIETPLEKDHLHKEIQVIEAKYPDLFDHQSNLWDLELARDEIELLEDELKQKETELRINEKLSKNLSTEIAHLTNEKIESEVKQSQALETCSELSRNLDRATEQLCNRIYEYGQFLYDVSQNPSSEQYLNCMNLEELEENFNTLAVYISSIAKAEDDLLQLDSSSDPILSTLPDIRNRLFHSMMSSLSHNMELEKLDGALQFLRSYNTNLSFSIFDCSDLYEQRINCKKEQQNPMFEMVERSKSTMADNYVNQLKQKTARHDLRKTENKLEILKKIDQGTLKLLAQIGVINILNNQEAMDFRNADKFFSAVYRLTKDLVKCDARTQTMSEISAEFEEANSKGIEDQFKLIGTFGKILGKKNSSIQDILNETSHLKQEISNLERKLFSLDSNIYRDISQKFSANITALQNFLICGPTSRIVSVPENLHRTMNKVDLMLEKQNSAVQDGIQIYRNALKKLSNEKGLRDRRCLWMYFVCDPQKMLSIMDKADAEFRKQLKSDS